MMSDDFASRVSGGVSTTLQPKLAFVGLDQLKEHEDVDPVLLEKMREEIASDGS